MNLRELYVEVGFNGGQAIGGLQNVDRAADQTKANLIAVGQQFDQLGKDMVKMGKGLMTKVTLPLVGVGVASAKTMIDMEDAMSGVRKTFDGTEEELQGVLDALDRLAMTDLPVPRKALYGIAELAGQLGVEAENIAGFSETIAKIGRVTDLGYDEGATSLAKFANVMQMDMDNIERLGSTVVHLDKSLATSASNIVGFGTRLAAAGKQAGMTEADVMGIGGALSSLAISAEAGGTAFSKVILDMTGAVHRGGIDLELYGAIAGTTGEQFKEAFEQDAAGALGMFIDGLGQLEDAGFNITEVLEGMGFSDFRVADALRRSAGAGELFGKSITEANKAWEENIALQETFLKRTDNIAGRIDIVKNKTSKAFQNIGLSFKENIIGGLEAVGRLADWFNALDEGTQRTIVRVGAYTAAIGPAIFITGKLVQGIGRLTTGFAMASQFAKNSLTTMHAVRGGAITLGQGLNLLLGPTGLVITTLGGVVVAGVLLYKNWEKVKIGADKLTGSIIAVKNKFIEWWPVIKKTGIVLGAIFGPALIKTGIQAAQTASVLGTQFIGSLVKTGTQSVIAGSKMTAVFIKSLIQAGAQAIKTATIVTGQLVTAIANYAVSGWKAVASVGATITAWVAQKGAIIASAVATKAMTVAQWALNTAMLANPIGLVVVGIGALVGAIALLWNKSEGFRNFFADMWSSIAGAVKTAINSVIGFINIGIEGLNKIKVPDWVPFIGGKGVNISPIPKLATGTNFFSGGEAIVGEKGPERVIMPRGARVQSNSTLRNITPEGSASATNYINETFAPHINITIDGSTDSIKESIPDIKKEIEKALYPLLEEYWAQMRIKRPSLV